MTREEAIRVLTENRPSLIFEDEEAQKRMADLCEAIDMAIEALQAETNKAVPPKRDDLVEVVRCGSCKNLLPDGRCEEFADDCIRPSATDFCSHGERREP